MYVMFIADIIATLGDVTAEQAQQDQTATDERTRRTTDSPVRIHL